MDKTWFIEEHEMQLAVCPMCGKALDGCYSITQGRRTHPTPGAVALCNGCASFNILTDDYFLRAATPDEIKKILSDPHNRKLMFLTLEYIKKNKKA